MVRFRRVLPKARECLRNDSQVVRIDNLRGYITSAIEHLQAAQDSPLENRSTKSACAAADIEFARVKGVGVGDQDPILSPEEFEVLAEGKRVLTNPLESTNENTLQVQMVRLQGIGLKLEGQLIDSMVDCIVGGSSSD